MLLSLTMPRSITHMRSAWPKRFSIFSTTFSTVVTSVWLPAKTSKLSGNPSGVQTRPIHTFRSRSAKLPHRQNSCHIGPCDFLATRLDQFSEQLVKPQPAPKCQGQKNAPKLPHPLHAQILQIRQLPTRILKRLPVPIEKVPFFGPGPPPLQQGFQIFPSSREILLREFLQTGHPPLTRPALGANRLAQPPIFVNLSVESLAVFAQKHAASVCASSAQINGLFSTTWPQTPGDQNSSSIDQPPWSFASTKNPVLSSLLRNLG